MEDHIKPVERLMTNKQQQKSQKCLHHHEDVEGSNISLKEFRLNLIQQMLEQFASAQIPSRRGWGRPSSHPPPMRLVERHFLQVRRGLQENVWSVEGPKEETAKTRKPDISV
ncbi:hypothetical protein L798_04416 [Zootermopsis nevadensis]|uniref:Uncharacterized protein n=1 Tax=Zootermopsis nevadensis TaxID=136037 RepID=A0A067QF76_ZOONE|nr:hypothetical protein L798_04416 [Zootermopsis nevadensis]